MNTFDPDTIIEYQKVECPNHDPEGCECDNGIMTIIVEHDVAPDPEDYFPEPDYDDYYDNYREPDPFKAWDDYIDWVDCAMGYRS